MAGKGRKVREEEATTGRPRASLSTPDVAPEPEAKEKEIPPCSSPQIPTSGNVSPSPLLLTHPTAQLRSRVWLGRSSPDKAFSPPCCAQTYPPGSRILGPQGRRTA